MEWRSHTVSAFPRTSGVENSGSAAQCSRDDQGTLSQTTHVQAETDWRYGGLTGREMSASLASLTVDAALRACPVVMVGSAMLAEPLPVIPHNSQNTGPELFEADLFN